MSDSLTTSAPVSDKGWVAAFCQKKPVFIATKSFLRPGSLGGYKPDGAVDFFQKELVFFAIPR